MPKKERPVFLFFLLIVPLIWSGCSEEQIKKTENSNKIHALFDVLNRLKKNYDSKNSSAFFSDISPTFQNYENTKTKISEVFNRFDTISINLYIDHIVIEPSSSSIVIRWEGQWAHQSEEPIKRGGNAVFKFSTEPTPLLLEIQGSNPFIFPLIEK